MELDHRVLRVAAEVAGGPVRVVGTLVDHHERCVLDVVLPDGRRAVVKGDLVAERSAREARVLAAAAATDVPVPAMIGRAAGPPAVLVLERIDGEWLSPDRPTRAWAATGAVVRRLHELAVRGLDGFAGQDGWAAGLSEMTSHWGRRSRSAGLDGAVVDAVAAALDRLTRLRATPPPVVTLHGDCVPIHVRLDRAYEVVGLLDLGDTCRGDPAWDLAVLTMRSPERLPAVLDGYGAEAGLRGWVETAWPAYRALRLVAEVAWLPDHGFDPTEVVAEATAAADALES